MLDNKTIEIVTNRIIRACFILLVGTELFAVTLSAQEFTIIKDFDGQVLALKPTNPAEVGYALVAFQPGNIAVAFRENGDPITLFPDFNPDNGMLIGMHDILENPFEMPILPNGQLLANNVLTLDGGDARFGGYPLSSNHEAPLGYDPVGTGGYGYDKFIDDLGNPKEASIGLMLRIFFGRSLSPQFREDCDASLGGFRGHSPSECSSFGFESRSAVYGNMATVVLLPLGWAGAGISTGVRFGTGAGIEALKRSVIFDLALLKIGELDSSGLAVPGVVGFSLLRGRFGPQMSRELEAFFAAERELSIADEVLYTADDFEVGVLRKSIDSVPSWDPKSINNDSGEWELDPLPKPDFATDQVEVFRIPGSQKLLITAKEVQMFDLEPTSIGRTFGFTPRTSTRPDAYYFPADVWTRDWARGMYDPLEGYIVSRFGPTTGKPSALTLYHEFQHFRVDKGLVPGVHSGGLADEVFATLMTERKKGGEANYLNIARQVAEGYRYHLNFDKLKSILNWEKKFEKLTENTGLSSELLGYCEARMMSYTDDFHLRWRNELDRSLDWISRQASAEEGRQISPAQLKLLLE